MLSINSLLRFLLEIWALIALGQWGYSLSDTSTKYFYAIVIPLVFAICWGVFAVQGDPSRSGQTVISTPGWIRLIFECVFFGLAVFSWYQLDKPQGAGLMFILIVIHYAIDYKRVHWLLNQG